MAIDKRSTDYVVYKPKGEYPVENKLLSIELTVHAATFDDDDTRVTIAPKNGDRFLFRGSRLSEAKAIASLILEACSKAEEESSNDI